MVDPFLQAHYARPLVFRIDGRLSPMSIRDQMIRGRWIVDRAFVVGLISTQRPLLVVGAGAAGVTAAIWAAQHNVPTTLIEKVARPFARLAGCGSRWVDPLQYDWPLMHWDQAVYPWRAPDDMPLPWPAGYAQNLVTPWEVFLKRAQQAYSQLEVLYNTEIIGDPFTTANLIAPPHMHEVPLSTLSTPKQVGMVVFSTGSGTERCQLDAYRSFAFWDNDQFALPDLGLPTPPRLLISGGGDGALQDFLRIITRHKSAKELYRSLRLPTDVERRLGSVEDDANRNYLWGATRQQDHETHRQLQHVHQEVIDELLANTNPAAPGLYAALTAALRNPLPMVELVFPCEHFSQVYGLNRFLVLLLATFLERHHPSRDNPLRPRTRVVAVAGLQGHICQREPSACHGQPHQVIVEDGHHCVRPQTTSKVLATPYQAIFLRHGIDPPNPVLRDTGEAVPNSRQALPYHVAY